MKMTPVIVAVLLVTDAHAQVWTYENKQPLGNALGSKALGSHLDN